ncbi:hypothetical protein IHE71_22845 [Myceligenerans sp. TRM 65318]|uniref:Rhamnogalacturonan lyase family 11 C-terminal domain-containing protein n=1 Tax=Myceligenerans pegani TaxID=2776917 RepID=A0ABR9N4D9_9MICO|nr:hypothetical protein [Myceligenerans sp. TRM 65318]MBE1878536.1 hypothetical protein [Myceligenerans sp. TRM 65318]MBE3020807.1 hypothetical protein [Myceligenerans sp. TRM 65318]
MHDPMYRQGVANQNGGYNSPGSPSFCLGDEAELPSMRTDIAVQDPGPLASLPDALDAYVTTGEVTGRSSRSSLTRSTKPKGTSIATNLPRPSRRSTGSSST